MCAGREVRGWAAIDPVVGRAADSRLAQVRKNLLRDGLSHGIVVGDGGGGRFASPRTPLPPPIVPTATHLVTLSAGMQKFHEQAAIQPSHSSTRLNCPSGAQWAESDGDPTAAPAPRRAAC